MTEPTPPKSTDELIFTSVDKNSYEIGPRPKKNFSDRDNNKDRKRNVRKRSKAARKRNRK